MYKFLEAELLDQNLGALVILTDGQSFFTDLLARIPEWVAMPFSKGSFWLRDWTRISCIGRQILYQ